MTCKRLIALCVAVLAFAAFAAPAQASIGIETFETSTSADPQIQAGSHPDLTTTFALENPGNPEAAKNVEFNAPEGVFGNPNALTRCTASDFALMECPVNSQAGVITIKAKYEGNDEYVLGTAPVFDMAPQSIETARLAFYAPTVNIPIAIPVAVRTGGDYGLRFTVAEITQQIPLQYAKFTVWGMPGLSSHDSQRFAKGSPGNPAGCPGLESASCGTTGKAITLTVKPLLNMPTTCSGAPLVTELEVQSYQDLDHPSHAQSSYPPMTGCEHETFDPFLAASLTTTQTDSASGLNLRFHVPQTLGFTPSPSEAKAVIVTLPEGLTVNPDAADGQTMCTDAQANFGSESPGECPDQSKIGTIALGTPALDGPLVGSIYIGEPKPGDQYRLFMILGGFGVNAKLVGTLHPDPVTGRLVSDFEDLPQVPFDDFDIHLFSSDRGLLATPTRCTLYQADALFIPWNGRLASQNAQQFFSLDSGPGGSSCPGQVRPFNPRLVAGSSVATAGAFSDFHVRLDRDDGDQFLGDLNFKMPPGFTGDLGGIRYCPVSAIEAAAQSSGHAEQVSPSCPASSQVGTTNVAAGPGSHPFHAIGRLYLAGPLNGAPLSLAAITPALAGPYDYGNVVVRVGLNVDPLTAQVSAVSDRMPQIIGGVPIRMRSIQVNINREHFTINPTNCSNFSVDSQGIGDQGTVTDFSSPFHAVDCATLNFKPRMTVRQLGSRKDTKRTKNPRLQFDLYTRPGDANLKSLSVTLPRAFQIDQRHLGNICSRAQLEREHCAGRQAMGSVRVDTPLLDQPLSGPAYAVSGFGKLPRVVFILAGQVTLMPQAESLSVNNGHLKTTVPVIPDAPVGHFRLTLLGGSKGYLVNSQDLCKSVGKIAVEYQAQNGKAMTQKISPKVPCGAKKPGAKRARR
jgi:hypothetical protein